MHRRGRQGQEVRSKKLIFLAQAVRDYPTQLRADMQRYYGLNLDGLGADFDAFHAGACAICLPAGSSLFSAVDQRASWSSSDYMLHGILQALVGKEIPFPWSKKKSGIEGIETESLPLDEFIEWYENSNWKEVDGWHLQ